MDNVRTWIILGVTLIFLFPIMGTTGNMPTTKKTLVHGHRGSRGTHPENSMPAFKEAVDAGADFLEMDLHLSRDGVLVVNHDPQITAQHCKGPHGKPVESPIPLNTLTAQEISQYDCGSVAQPKFPEQKLIPGTRIPTFEELLQWWKKEGHGIGLNVEMKMDMKPTPDPTVFAQAVISMLKKYGALKHTFLQSFDFSTLTAAKKIDAEVTMSCLFEADEKDIVNRTVTVGCKAISPEKGHVTPQMVADAHAKGLQVVPWTVNTTTDWDRLIQAKVDAIITDYPRKLIAYLKINPL